MWVKVGLWLASTRTGRVVAAAASLAVAITIALLKAFSAGKSVERAKQDRASLDNLRDRQRTEDRIDTMPIHERQERLNQWSKD